MIATLLAVLSISTQSQDKALFRDDALGLQFEYPKNWRLRKNKNTATFEVPLEKTKPATIQIFKAKFKGPVDDWQAIQSQINTAMKRKIDRQWSEDYLGVPMLLTKISYVVNEQPTVGIIGLLYSRFESKLNFRLTTPTEHADAVETAWRETMLSLRTISGDLPEVDDPDKPSIKPIKPKPTTVLEPSTRPTKVVRGPVKAEAEFDSTKFVFNLPDGWSIKDGELRHPGLDDKATIFAKIGLEMDSRAHLLDSAKSTLTEFEKVTLREDPPAYRAESGAVVEQVFRKGLAKGTAFQVLCLTGTCEGVFWAVMLRSNDPKRFAKSRGLIDQLSRTLYVEKA